MFSDKLKTYSYKTIYQSMKMFRSNDPQLEYDVYYGHCPFSNLCNTHLVYDGIHNATVVTIVSARQKSAERAKPASPSIRPSVKRVNDDQSKTVGEDCAIFTPYH